MKKIIAAFLITSMMILSLTACGDSTEATTADTAETTTEEVTAEDNVDVPAEEVAVEETPAEEEVTEPATAEVNPLTEYIGKPLTEFMENVSESEYTATYFADDVDFTDFIDLMKDDYTVGGLDINETDKTVEVTLVLTSNIEAAEDLTALNEKLEEGAAWIATENYGQAEYGEDFDLNYLIGKIYAGLEDENTWFLKAECTLYGVDMTCEAKVTGTTNAPEVIFFDIY